MCNICARCSKTMLVFWEILLSLSARRVWIEIAFISMHMSCTGSLSARRVWIEIVQCLSLACQTLVTLREEGVD